MSSTSWKHLTFLLSILGSLAFTSCTGPTDIYVDPAGDDANPGTKGQPVTTLARARDLARPFAGKKSVTVNVADGTYYLPETLVFTAADSGSAEYPVIYKSVNEGGAVLSGGSKLDLKWTVYRDPASLGLRGASGIYMARIPSGLQIDQLFINGKRQRMARYPNYDPRKKAEAYQGFATDAFSKERAANWKDPAGGYIHAMHRNRWGGYHYLITGKDANGEVTYEGGWQNNRQMGMHNDFRMVENIFEELDAPGEWFHNAETHSTGSGQADTLYYKPEAGVDLNKAKVEVVRLRHLIEFQGSEMNPVKHISLQGFVVRQAARTFMDTKEPLLRSDWTIYRGGSVLLTGTEDVSILDCEFDQVGGNAIFVNKYNRGTLVKGCHIHDAGASGVCFVGDPNAVRDPLFEYKEKNDLSQIDRTPGPKTNNYPKNGVVEDCLIHGIGRVERQPAGVQISMSMDITVRDTSIYDCARSGINVSEGTWGGHLIERCDVFDTVLETHDHGSFNSWGRDRYWRSDHLDTSQKAVDAYPEFPFIDAMKTTVIRDSRWRCDHGWDIDLDDGSSNYDIYNNLMLNGGLKFREGFRRRAWNNITVNNGFHPHVWFDNSQDELFSNILFTEHKAIRVGFSGKRVNSNLFFSDNPDIKERYLELDWDKNSIIADPLFVNPSNGDFRVQAESPAFEIGFQNFPMDQFGVKKPSLKAIARTPVIPELIIEFGKPLLAEGTPCIASHWLGARLHALEGEEFSAYGVSKEDGGIALVEVPEGSKAALAGFKTGDLILSINSIKLSSVSDLLQYMAVVGDSPLKVEIVREQKSMVVRVGER